MISTRAGCTASPSIGTRFTIEGRFFGKLEHIDVVQPRAQEIDCIHSAYIEIVNAGRGSEEHAAVLRKIANVLVNVTVLKRSCWLAPSSP